MRLVDPGRAWEPRELLGCSAGRGSCHRMSPAPGSNSGRRLPVCFVEHPAQGRHVEGLLSQRRRIPFGVGLGRGMHRRHIEKPVSEPFVAFGRLDDVWAQV